jgi:hypothetical protein
MRDIKQRIFIRKVMTGVSCRPGERFRVFVLTESDEAIDKGYKFTLKCKHLMAHLRKKYGGLEYVCVLHRQGTRKRLNYHVLYYGPYIPQQEIEDWWFKNYGSHRSKMEEIRNPASKAAYLSKYLKGEDFVSARFSKRWVFPKWWDFCYWIKKEFGEYPAEDMVVNLSHMNLHDLKNNEWYSLFESSKIKNMRGGNGRVNKGAV